MLMVALEVELLHRLGDVHLGPMMKIPTIVSVTRLAQMKPTCGSSRSRCGFAGCAQAGKAKGMSYKAAMQAAKKTWAAKKAGAAAPAKKSKKSKKMEEEKEEKADDDVEEAAPKKKRRKKKSNEM